MSLGPMDPLCVSLVHQYLASTKSNLVDEFKSKHQPTKTNLTLEEVVSKWKEEQLARGLVYQHLKRVTPALAEEFANQFFSMSDSEIVVEVIEQEQLIRSLVFQHLQRAAPALAQEFEASCLLQKTVSASVNVLEFIENTKEMIQQSKEMKNETVPGSSVLKESLVEANKRGRRGMKVNTYTGEEVAMIEKAMSNKENLAVVAKQLGRSYKSILDKAKNIERAASASKTGRFSSEEMKRIRRAVANNEDFKHVAQELGRIPKYVSTKMLRMKCNPNLDSTRRKFTPEEHFLILDEVLPGLKTSGLSGTGFLSLEVLLRLATELKRNFEGVRLQWDLVLQPWLLQHYTGTSGLRVEIMVTSLVAQKFRDHRGVDWSLLVREHKEFAGHTSASIRRIFYGCLGRAMKRKNKSDVNLKEVAEYAAEVYQPGREKREPLSKSIHREKVIAYFTTRAKELGIEIAV